MNNPNLLHDLSEIVLVKLAQAFNNFFDRDSPIRNGFVAIIGLFITLFTLHKVEVRMRATISYMFASTPFLTLAGSIFLVLLIYFLFFHLELNANSLRRNLNAQNLGLFLISVIFLYVAYIQLLKVNNLIALSSLFT